MSKQPEILEENPDAAEFQTSRYIKWYDLLDTESKDVVRYREIKAEIFRVTKEMAFTPATSKKEKALHLYFKGAKKQLIPCGTNQQLLMASFGKNSQAWIGKSITLYVDKNANLGKGKKGPAVRIKL